MVKRTLVFWSDPGHSWLIVQKKDLITLKIDQQVSDYSYSFKDTVLLEEDCDAPLYLYAAKKEGWKIKTIEQHVPHNFNVRGLPGYRTFRDEVRAKRE